MPRHVVVCLALCSILTSACSHQQVSGRWRIPSSTPVSIAENSAVDPEIFSIFENGIRAVFHNASSYRAEPGTLASRGGVLVQIVPVAHTSRGQRLADGRLASLPGQLGLGASTTVRYDVLWTDAVSRRLLKRARLTLRPTPGMAGEALGRALGRLVENHARTLRTG